MWFASTMGFVEESPEQVRSLLRLEGTTLHSTVNGARIGCGRLSVPSLHELRALDRPNTGGPSRVSEIVGDVGALHREPSAAGALFQAASQFNLLEMVSPRVTPEAGVGGYSHDKTQGPACAIACGGGTIYRNYFADVDGQTGQTADRQIDCLADLERELGPGLWDMQNGYALASEDGLHTLNARLAGADEAERDRLRGLLRIGIQHDVQVLGTEHSVTQVYGSALPVAYGRPPAHLWEPFARLILEASYEATLRAARIWQAEPAYLTLLGGGVFGNASSWIEDAIVRAVERVPGVDVRIVSYGSSSSTARAVVARCGDRPAEAEGRTSRSHPLRVDWVEAPGGPAFGLTFAPGKVQATGLSGKWRRSLEVDLDRLARVHGVDDLVCLVEDHELHALQIAALPERAAAHGIQLHRMPVQDGGVPSPEAMAQLQASVRSWRADGRRVVFHCMGGLGRAGTAGACCLVTEGIESLEAMMRVRDARPGAIETRAQERFIRSYATP